MSTQKHIFAIRFNGKTLGIRDAQQLVRLVDTDQLGAADKVFVIAEKRWIGLTEVPEVASYLAQTAMKQGFEPLEFDTSARRGREFDTMVNELETLRPAPVQAPSPAPLKLRVGPAAQRLTQPMIAARRPNPEGPSPYSRVILIAGTAALLVGMVFGFFAFDAWLAPTPAPDRDQQPTLLLQAQKEMPADAPQRVR